MRESVRSIAHSDFTLRSDNGLPSSPHARATARETTADRRKQAGRAAARRTRPAYVQRCRHASAHTAPVQRPGPAEAIARPYGRGRSGSWHCNDAATRGRAIAFTRQKSGRRRVRDRSACSLTVSTTSSRDYVWSPKRSLARGRAGDKSDRGHRDGGPGAWPTGAIWRRAR